MRLIVAALCLLPALVWGQSERDVFRAFDRLQARIEVGINLRDYTTALGDINYELKSFTEAAKTSKERTISEALSTALNEHKMASSLWEYNIQMGSRYGSAAIELDSTLGRSMAERYPDSIKPRDEGGALTGSKKHLDVEILRRFAWRAAQAHVTRAKGAR